MKKLFSFLLIAAFAFGGSAFAAVQLSGSGSLFSSPKTAPASSAPLGLFEFSLSQDAGESLVSVGVLVQPTGTSTIVSSDLGALNLYRDNGDGLFNPSVDVVAGSQGTVLIGSTTTISATSNNSLSSATSTPTKFFVSLGTGATWSDALTPDSVTVTLVQNSIITTSNSPSSAPVTAPAIVADTTGPKLVSAVAHNTGPTGAKEAGDTIVLHFNESTNKVSLSSSSVAALLSVNNGHTILDANGNLGSASWDASGKQLTITLSGSSSTTVPTVTLGDTIQIAAATPLMDAAGNKATGAVTLVGTFGTVTPPPTIPSDSTCTNALINGRLYSVEGYMFIYQAKECKLVLLKGEAYYPVAGNQFENVIHLSVFPQPGQPTDPVITPRDQAKLELKELLKQRRAEIEMVRQKYEVKIEELKKKIDEQKSEQNDNRKEERKKVKEKVKKLKQEIKEVKKEGKKKH